MPPELRLTAAGCTSAESFIECGDIVAEKRKKTKKNRQKSEKTISVGAARRLKAAAVVIVVLLLVSIAAAQVGGITFSTVGDYFASAFSRIGAGDGYPYSINGMGVSDVTVTNSDLVLVYDDSVKVLNSTAKEISSLNHSYDHPVVNANSGRILLYDEGGTQFRVQSKTRVLYEKETEYIILTGAIGKDGSVALVTRADGAESMLTVIDSHRDEVFAWKCSKENIVSCDVSDNGKNYAVSVIGVENGSVYSKVYLFNKKETAPTAEFSYPDSAVSTVQFLSNETLMIMGGNVCEIINDGAVSQKIDVSVNTPFKLFISDNNTAVLVLSKYSSTTSKIIKVYDKSGEELFSREIDGLVKSVATDGKYIGVLTDSSVQVYNRKGEVRSSAEVNTDAEKVLIASRNTYIYSLNSIEQYSSVGDN